MTPAYKRALLAAALLAVPASAAAQNEVASTANQVAEQAQELEQTAEQLQNQAGGGSEEQHRTAREEGDGFDWGLLGLLGLAGLLGLRRRDDHHTHVDARRDHRH